MKTLIATLIFLSISVTHAAVQYNFSPKAGNVEFKTKGWPNLVTIKGKGEGASGNVNLNEDKISGTLAFDLTSLKTGISLRDDHMKNKYLQVKEFPKAELTLKDVKVPKDLKGSMDFKGSMKLHGVIHEVSGKADLSGSPDKVVMKAEIPIKLKDFKIEIPSYKGITVADKVTISFKTDITKTK